MIILVCLHHHGHTREKIPSWGRASTGYLTVSWMETNRYDSSERSVQEGAVAVTLSTMNKSALKSAAEPSSTLSSLQWWCPPVLLRKQQLTEASTELTVHISSFTMTRLIFTALVPQQQHVLTAANSFSKDSIIHHCCFKPLVKHWHTSTIIFGKWSKGLSLHKALLVCPLPKAPGQVY